MKVCIDPGHGGTDSGAVGNGYYEKNLTLEVSKTTRDYLKQHGIDAVLTRDSDITLDPNPRVQVVKDSKPDICVSIHFNASNGNGSGVETIYQMNNSNSQKLAQLVLDSVSQLGITKRTAYSKESQTNPGRDYYFMLRLTRPIDSIIVECMFIDNANDMKFMSNTDSVQSLSEAIGKGVLNYFGLTPQTKTPIMGNSVATVIQMEQFLHSVNPSAPYYAQIYFEEGMVEGVRGDLAFAQSLLETNYFRFGGKVSASQNNFAGLGATGSVAGAKFSTPIEGIRAQIQHLKAYASTLPTIKPIVDPRFNYVTRGCAPNIEDLNGKWAVPGIGYGEMIVSILNKIIAVYVNEQYWSKPYFDNLSALGIVQDPHNPDSNPTWGELAAVVSRTIDYLKR